MKALIAAGGHATRLRPITQTINKHLIPLANKPLLAYAIEKMARAGVKEIYINVNPGETEIPRVFGDGSQWGVRLNYVEQTGGALGVAHIVKNARPYLQDEPFIFYLGDNIILGELDRFVRRFEEDKLDALLALSRVKDPQRFGVPVLEDGRIVRVLEKPAVPPSDYAVTGIYLYSPSVFDHVDHLTPSARGELEISELHTRMIEQGHQVGYEEITGWWKDTGKPEDMILGNALILAELSREEATIRGEVHPETQMNGRVQIGTGTVIGPGCVIRGPVSIGENCRIERSYIGPFTSLGNGVTMQGAEVEHSIVFDNALIRSASRIVDALIGQNAVVVPCADTRPAGHRLVVGDNSLVEI
jgi:glucose-1-phosphate thymidylyltransferase